MTTESKREQFTKTGAPRRVTPTTIAGVAAIIFGLAVLYMAARTPPGAGSPGAAGQAISLPAAQFDDGVARFYTHTTAAGRQVRFFVVKSSDGVIRAAFDACDTCYQERKGYRQQGDAMVCNNCSQTFRSTDINVLRGGCNPAPLDRSVARGQVLLTADALDAGAGYF